MTVSPSPRNAFDRWLFENRLSLRKAAPIFGCSYEYLRQVAAGLRVGDGEKGRRIRARLAADGISLPTQPDKDMAAAHSSPAQVGPHLGDKSAGEAFSSHEAAA